MTAARFDVFLSYNQAADHDLAEAIQVGLERFAKPWNRRRALRVFRDNSAMGVSPELWPAIVDSLDRSDWLVVLASPGARRSKWVNREIEHWLNSDQAAAKRLLLVVTDGDLVWDEARSQFDRERSSALPDSIPDDLYTSAPRHLDMRWYRATDGSDRSANLDLQNARFRSAIAEIAAPVHDMPKDELDSEAVRLERRARRLRRGAIAGLAGLSIVASTLAVVATVNADRARHNATVAQARFLAIRSSQMLDDNANAARQLAAQAYFLDQTSMTEASLFASLAERGQVSRVASLPSPARVVAGASDGTRLFAGLENGMVVAVSSVGGPITVLGTLNGSITHLSTDDTGTLVAAASVMPSAGVADVRAWGADGQLVPFAVNGDPTAVHVMATGGQLLVGVEPEGETLGLTREAYLVDATSGATRKVPASQILLPSRELLNLSAGSWAVIDIESSAELRSEFYGFGSKQWLISSPTGTHVAMAGGFFAVPVWSTGNGGGDGLVHSPECPVNNAACDLWQWAGSFPDGFARGPNGGEFVLSADGTQVAWSEAASVYVSSVVAPEDIENIDESVRSIDGVGMATALSFVGDRIFVGTAEELLLVEPDASSSVRRSVDTDVYTECTACVIPNVALSPDGRQLAKGGWGVGLTVQDLFDGTRREIGGQDLHPVTWLDDASLAVVDLETSSVKRAEMRETLTVSASVGLPGLDNLSAGGGLVGGTLSKATGTVYFITRSGQIWALDAETLEPKDTSTVPELADDLGFDVVTFSPSGTHAVSRRLLINLATGSVEQVIDDYDRQLLISDVGPVVLSQSTIEHYDLDLQLISSTTIAPEDIYVGSIDPTGRWIITVHTGGETASIKSAVDGATVATVPLGASAGGTARILFDDLGTAVLLHTSSPDSPATAEIIMLRPEFWLEALCRAPDYRPLSSDEWTALTQLPTKPTDPCEQ